MRRETKFRLAALVLSLVASLAVAEVVGRLAFPVPQRSLVWPPHQTVLFTPADGLLPGVSGPSRYHANAWGVRGDEFEEGQFRVLAIGGSFVECIYLDQPESWPALLQADLQERLPDRKVWVGNIGKTGLECRDHIFQLETLLAEYPRIDVALIVAGVNDLGRFFRWGERFDPARLEYSREDLLARSLYDSPEKQRLMPAAKRTGLFRLARRGKLLFALTFPAQALASNRDGTVLQEWGARRQRAPHQVDAVADMTSILSDIDGVYGRMIDLCRARGVRPVLATHPVLWRADLPAEEQRFLWMGGIGEVEADGNDYVSVRAMAEAMDRYQARQLAFCRERGIDCFDLAARIPRDTEHFYDDCHVTEKGAALVADLLAEFLAERVGDGRK